MHNTMASTLPEHEPGDDDSRVTQCPQCQTAFRVTSEQMRLANGHVRCGSCLDVFEAALHWSDTDQIPSEEVPESAPATNDQVAIPDASGSREMEFSDAFMQLDGQDRQPDSLAAIAASSEQQSDDEEWARQILEEEARSSEPKNELLEAIMAAPASQQPQSDESTDQFESAAATNYEQSEFNTTESWMAELLGDDTQQQSESIVESATHQAQQIDYTAEPDQDYVPEIFRSKLIDGIQSEPLEMHLRRHISPLMRHGLMILGIVLACAVLLGQYAWHNSERLAHDPGYRPLLTQFCQATGCAMPPAYDISRIRSSNLVVLKHPRVANALLLDTIITNYSNFEQAYPRLAVEFSDLHGTTVASRIFSPADYLGGDLVGTTTMPIRRPIHLSLELLDPGERAISYKIRLLPPTSP